MAKKSIVSIAHYDGDLGTPSNYTQEHVERIKDMIRQIADDTKGGMQNIVHESDVVFIKINTVNTSPAENGFTTDPRMLQALIEVVNEQKPKKVQIGERCALGQDTMKCFEVCGIKAVAEKTGAELVALENTEWEMHNMNRPISYACFPFPKVVKEANVYIGLPKMKVHIHTGLTNAMKLQFGLCPDYKWMSECHRDDIYQKIANLTSAADPDWFIVDSLWTCQGNGPFSPYPDDRIVDWNTTYGGSDPVAIDTVAEMLMQWDNPGNLPSTVMGAAEGLGTNKLDEIELKGVPVEKVSRHFNRQDSVLCGKFKNVNVIVGSACEPGCRVMVRMGLDAAYVAGLLDKLREPITIFVGLQFEPYIKDVKGPVLIYGQCAKKMAEFYPDAYSWFPTEEHPTCVPMYSNIPGRGIPDIIQKIIDSYDK